MAKSPRHNLIKYILAGGALIFFWRGIWGLADLYLIPHIPAASYIVSVIIGIVLLVIDHRYLKELQNH